jgi:hypothetical protein
MRTECDGVRDRVYGDADRDVARVDRGRDIVRSIAAFLP